jgi:hypothetical protein
MRIHGVAGVRRQAAPFKLIQPAAVLLTAAVVLLVLLLLMMSSIVVIVMVAVVVLPMLLFSRIGGHDGHPETPRGMTADSGSHGACRPR